MKKFLHNIITELNDYAALGESALRAIKRSSVVIPELKQNIPILINAILPEIANKQKPH